MLGPYIEPVGHTEASQQQDPDLDFDLSEGNRAGGNGPVRLINGVDVFVVVIVDGLGESSEQRTTHQHASECSQHVIQLPVVVAAGCCSAYDTPNQGDPSDRFHQLQPQLPDIGGARGTFHAQQLTCVAHRI